MRCKRGIYLPPPPFPGHALEGSHPDPLAISGHLPRASLNVFHAVSELASLHTGAPAACAGFSTESETAVGVNILKAGSDPPLPSDSDCPPWLWNLAEPPLTLGLLQRKSVNELDVPMVRRTAGSAMCWHAPR